jgi:hypothetical protein
MTRPYGTVSVSVDAGGTADHDLLAAAADLDCVTLFGRFALDPATGHRPATS